MLLLITPSFRLAKSHWRPVASAIVSRSHAEWSQSSPSWVPMLPAAHLRAAAFTLDHSFLIAEVEAPCPCKAITSVQKRQTHHAWEGRGPQCRDRQAGYAHGEIMVLPSSALPAAFQGACSSICRAAFHTPPVELWRGPQCRLASSHGMSL